MSANVPDLELRAAWRLRWQKLLAEWGAKGLAAAPSCDEWRAAIRLLDALEALEAENRILRRRLKDGTRFLSIFDSIMADENDGTSRIYSDDALHNAATKFRAELPADLQEGQR